MMTWPLWIAAGLAVVGVAFAALGALGILLMTDPLIRLHAASKASTLGAACLLVAAAIAFGGADHAVRAALIVAFLFATAPVGAHMLGRAAYLAKLELAPETVLDELKGRYDSAGRLQGHDAPGSDSPGPEAPRG
jgi:multicomponent Na+:H+ antiporter subunit G